MTYDPNEPQYQAYSDTKSAPRHPAARALTVMAYAFVAAIVVLGVVVAMMTAGSPTETTPMMLGVLIGLICAGLIQFLGYRIPALPAGAAPDPATVLEPYRASMMLRFALADTPALVSFAATIAFVGNVVSYLPGALISLALMIVHVVPNRGLVTRIERRLDADGGRSRLSVLFGY